MNRSRIEKIAKARADETRLRIFASVSRCGHITCGELVTVRGVTPATVSGALICKGWLRRP